MGLLRISVFIGLIAVGIYFLKQYMNGAVCESTERLDGKIVIITGANTGIGKETALDLVKRGAKVYMACRSLERAQRAVDDIISVTGVAASQLPIMHLDLGSLQSVRDFADDFKKRETRLDILINNAGVAWMPESKTVDGYETTFATNHLGHFLLTHLLIELMMSGNSVSRVINVSAKVYELGTIDFDDLMMTGKYSRFYTYCNSKLANVLFTRELARRLAGSHVTTYSLHPGVIRTELGRYLLPSFFMDNVVGSSLFYYLTWPVTKEPSYGAQTTICCAVSKQLETQTGKYYSECKEEELVAKATDDDVSRRLWDVSVQLVKLQTHEIRPELR